MTFMKRIQWKCYSELMFIKKTGADKGIFWWVGQGKCGALQPVTTTTQGVTRVHSLCEMCPKIWGTLAQMGRPWPLWPALWISPWKTCLLHVISRTGQWAPFKNCIPKSTALLRVRVYWFHYMTVYTVCPVKESGYLSVCNLANMQDNHEILSDLPKHWVSTE